MASATPGSDIAMWRSVPAAVIVAALVASAGCTLCPDPFDYSGPVPNGSPPQNDFRARSGGILPLNAAPKPWPPVVTDDTTLPEPSPAIADPEPQVADEADPAMLQQTGAIDPGADASGEQESTGNGTTSVVDPQVTIPTLTPVPLVPAAGAPVADPRPIDAGLQGMAPAPAGTPTETPGWRPRRRTAG